MHRGADAAEEEEKRRSGEYGATEEKAYQHHSARLPAARVAGG